MVLSGMGGHNLGNDHPLLCGIWYGQDQWDTVAEGICSVRVFPCCMAPWEDCLAASMSNAIRPKQSETIATHIGACLRLR